MLPDTFFQVMSITADLVLFLFVGHYMYRLYNKEKEIEKREKKIDTEYHQVVDDALTKERRILEDATNEAEQIIADTQFVSEGSKNEVDQALEDMKADIRKEVSAMAQSYRGKYQDSLVALTNESLQGFKAVSTELQESLQKQVAEFHKTMLPNLEKELDEYKQSRMKETDQTIRKIVQKVSQEFLNKSLSIDDHQKLLVDALEKAKREGFFE